MDKKLEMLQCLIGGRAFAPSHSALAKELGYKGKMGIYRLMGGTVRPDTVDKTWRLIMERYRLTEEFLCGMARTFFGAGLFYTTLAAQMNRSHPRWAENLVLSLTADLYDHCSPQFRAETAPVLKDLKTDEPNVYWGIVALVYIRAKGIDVYKGKGGPRSAAAQIIDALDRLLYGAYPEKAGAHEAASNLKAMAGGCTGLWSVVWNCVILFRHYAESGFMAEAAKALRLFGFGKRSYWLEPGSVYGPGAEVWLLTEQGCGRQTGRHYLTMRLRAGADICSFGLADAMLLQFRATDGEDGAPVLQVCRGCAEERQWCFYRYGYDAERRELRFEAGPDTGGQAGLPGALRMVDLAEPSGKDEKVWARILAEWDRSRGEAVFMQAREAVSGITDMSAAYRIAGVSLSKDALTIAIEHGGSVRRYRLPSERYGFLSEINPSQRVVITRHAGSGDTLFADWPELGYSVRLDEFTTA